jgi:hypothetical protein
MDAGRGWGIPLLQDQLAPSMPGVMTDDATDPRRPARDVENFIELI